MAIFKYNSKTVNQAYWGENNFPKAIYDDNTYRLRYVESNPTIDGKARLTLSDGTYVTIEGTGELTSAETQPYSATTVSAEIGSGCTSIGASAFTQFYSLSSLTISNSVTEIWRMAFSSCNKLTSLEIPSSVKDIHYYAFRYCTRLTSITCNPITPPPSAKYAFDNTNNCPIYVPAESVNAYKSATNWSSYASRITAIP